MIPHLVIIYIDHEVDKMHHANAITVNLKTNYYYTCKYEYHELYARMGKHIHKYIFFICISRNAFGLF